ncbi:MAG: InlB B-repeat-containing protein [Eubacteriales bacterium]|nr:InlB B-repeat-containing protein [Eubacteriales bacterium]
MRREIKRIIAGILVFMMAFGAPVSSLAETAVLPDLSNQGTAFSNAINGGRTATPSVPGQGTATPSDAEDPDALYWMMKEGELRISNDKKFIDFSTLYSGEFKRTDVFDAAGNPAPWRKYSGGILYVNYVGDVAPYSTAYWFAGLDNITRVSLSNMDATNLTDMSYMFSGCESLVNVYISLYNATAVTDMNHMFDGCRSLVVADMSYIDTSNVTDMSGMFNGCSKLTTIKVSSRWNTDSVSNSTNMFNGCTKLIGERGTAYSASNLDADYAKVDGGTGDEGYLTGKYATVTFNKKGVGADIAAQKVLYYGNATAPAPSATGYVFNGWYTESACTNEFDFDNTIIDENITLYASWTANSHNVSYAYSGTVPSGAPAAPSAETKTYGTNVSVAVAPTLAGYTFSGWTTADATVSSGSFSMPDNDVSFTGSWTINTDTPYKVEHYKQNVNDDGYTLVSADTENKTGTTGENTAAVAKTYTGFNANAFSQDTIKGDGTTVISIYYDRLTYTVNWKNGDTVLKTVSGLRYESAVPAFDAEAPTKASTDEYDYTFNGWDRTDSTVTGDLIFNAQFTPVKRSYTVTFNANGLGTAPSAKSVLYGEKVEEPVAPSVAGYIVTGWYREAECTSEWDFAADTITGAITLYAKWAPGTDTPYKVEHYKQNLKDDGYTIVSADTENKTGTTEQDTEAVAKSYTGFTAKAFNQESIEADGSTVIRIYYDRNLYTVTWMNENEVLEVDTDVKYGSVPSYDGAEPTMQGTDDTVFIFLGWYPEITSKTIVTADITYTADFVEVKEADPLDEEDEPKAAPPVTYSSYWSLGDNGLWTIRNRSGQIIRNSWLCDDAVRINEKSVWYLLDSNGNPVTAGLIRDASGNFYSFETEHNGYYGMLRFKNGFYNINGQRIYIEFEQSHNGSFGAIKNADAIARLQDIYGLTSFTIGNDSCTYTANF